MTSNRVFILIALALAVLASGCPLEAPPPLAPFDCGAVDRATERFPVECGDAGADLDASAADIDAASPNTDAGTP